MTKKTAANRYARALLDVAVQEKADPERIDQELTAFADLVKQHAELGKALLNPAIPVQRKRAAVVELTTSGKTSAIVSKLLVLLAERDRLVILPDLVAAYRERLLAYRNVVRAEVTTAAPLEPEKAQALEKRLARLTSRTVVLQTRVDPSIIGGVVAKVGSTVYDASVTRQLQRMKERLTA